MTPGAGSEQAPGGDPAGSPAIVDASSGTLLETVRQLFREYQEALGLDLCFQGFAQELAGLPGAYAPPQGRLLLALDRGGPIGCVALRPLEHQTAEMKRLYVRPGGRGRGTGRLLSLAVIGAARQLGHLRLRLDTLPSMTEAAALYRTLGFLEIPPYMANPVPGARCYELRLDAPHE